MCLYILSKESVLGCIAHPQAPLSFFYSQETVQVKVEPRDEAMFWEGHTLAFKTSTVSHNIIRFL